MNFAEIFSFLGNCLHNADMSNGLYYSLFAAGLIGGVSHCAAMCGPFVIAQSGESKRLRDIALFPYQFGRITTYIALAVLLSSILNLAFLYLPVRAFIVAPMLTLAGTIFLINAFPNLRQIFPWGGRIISFLPLNWMQKHVNALIQNPGVIKRYFLGILLGFMPCGLVVSALMAASTAPTPFNAALAMGAFGVGTMPSLMVTAFGVSAFTTRWPSARPYLTKGFMTISALWLFLMAGLILI